jgi:hypothetical protein
MQPQKGPRRVSFVLLGPLVNEDLVDIDLVGDVTHWPAIELDLYDFDLGRLVEPPINLCPRTAPLPECPHALSSSVPCKWRIPECLKLPPKIPFETSLDLSYTFALPHCIEGESRMSSIQNRRSPFFIIVLVLVVAALSGS